MLHYLDFEAKCLDASRTNSFTYLVESISHKQFKPKRKNNDKQGATGLAPKKAMTIKRKKSKCIGKKDKSEVVCFNCKKEGFFAREFTEPV